MQEDQFRFQETNNLGCFGAMQHLGKMCHPPPSPWCFGGHICQTMGVLVEVTSQGKYVRLPSLKLSFLFQHSSHWKPDRLFVP